MPISHITVLNTIRHISPCFPFVVIGLKGSRAVFKAEGGAMTVSWSRQALLKDKMNTGRYGILLYLFGFLYFPI